MFRGLFKLLHRAQQPIRIICHFLIRILDIILILIDWAELALFPGLMSLFNYFYLVYHVQMGKLGFH